MARPWSLSVVLLSLLVGAAPVGAQSPSPESSPGPTASEVPIASVEPASDSWEAAMRAMARGLAWVSLVARVPARGVGGSLTGPMDPRDVPYEYACSGLRFTAADVASAPGLGALDPDGLETVRSVAARNGWPDLVWRRVVTDGLRTLVYGTDGTGPKAMVVYGRGGVLIAASDEALCARAPGFTATAWVSLDPTKPAPGPDSRVLHLRSPGCPDEHALPARIAMLDGHVLLRVRLSGSSSEVGCREFVHFDVRLPRPLGDRRIWNAARLPLKELTR